MTMSSEAIDTNRPPPPLGVEGGDPLRRVAGGGLSTRVYLPACSIACLAAALVVIGWLTRWGGADFSGAMTSLRVVVVGPATLAIIAVFLVVERLRPAQRRPLVARGHRQDVLYTLLNATIVAPLVIALTLSFSDVARRALPWIVLPKFGTLPRWGAIALIFVAMDGLNWFAHLANHRVRVLWRFHELHHSQEDMSVLTVFRTHPLIHVSYLIALVPGIVLLANGALPTTLLVIYAATVALRAFEYQLGLRSTRAGLREPEFSPDPPPARRAAGCQPRVCPHDLGSVVASCSVSNCRHDQDRHRPSGPPLGRRTGGRSTTTSCRLCGSAHRPVPADARPGQTGFDP